MEKNTDLILEKFKLRKIHVDEINITYISELPQLKDLYFMFPKSESNSIIIYMSFKDNIKAQKVKTSLERNIILAPSFESKGFEYTISYLKSKIPSGKEIFNPYT